MKTGPFARAHSDPPSKRRELRVRIAAAQRFAEGKRDESLAAKVDFKRARKAFKRAKKIAKEARKNVKSLKRALAAVVGAAPAAPQKSKSVPIRLLRPAKPAPKERAPSPAAKKSPRVAPVRKSRLASPRKAASPPAPLAPQSTDDDSAAARGAPMPSDPSLPPNAVPDPTLP